MPAITCPAQGCDHTFRDDLDATVLNTLITLHARTSHPQATAQAHTPSAKMEKVRRPIISTSGTSEDWAYFLSRWQEYKLATHLTGPDILFQLLECADESLRKDLNRTYGTLTGETEQDALKHIKALAVKPENVMVARVQLQNITQDRDETVRAFCARLRGQAGVCRFLKSKTCPCNREVEVDYSDEIIRDALIRGLADEDIRLDILGQCRQDLTLDETLQIVEAKESGKRSAGMLTNTAVSMNAASSYKKKSNIQQKHSAKSHESENVPSTPCGYCGQKGHGNGRSRDDRRKSCPAYKHQCTECGVRHHFEQVCRARQPRNHTQHATPKSTNHDAVFNDNTSDNSAFFNGSVFDDVYTATESII